MTEPRSALLLLSAGCSHHRIGRAAGPRGLAANLVGRALCTKGLVVLLLSTTPALASAPPQLERTLAAALSEAGARAEVVEYRAQTRCQPSAVEVPLVRESGSYAVRLRGAGCEGWAWLRVRVLGPVWLTNRSVASGEPLETAVTCVEREYQRGRHYLTQLVPGARASRSLSPNLVLEAHHVVAGPIAGTPVTVLVRVNELFVEQQARAVLGADATRACAVLANGRRACGRYENGRILLEVP